MRNRGWLFSIILISLFARPTTAQDWSFDARAIGLGGSGSTKNIAIDLIDEERGYRAIVIPMAAFKACTWAQARISRW